MNLTSARHAASRVFPDSVSLRNVLRLVSGSTLSQLLMLAATPVVTRMYGPVEFSQLGLFLSFLGVATVVATLKYESAIVSADTASDADYLLLGCLTTALPCALVSVGVFAICHHLGLFGELQFPAVAVWLLLPAVLLAAAIVATRQWMVRESQYRGLSNSLIARSGGRVATQLGFALFGSGCGGLLLGELAARGVGVAVCCRQILPVLRSRHAKFDLRELGGVFRHYRRFPMFCLPSSLADALVLALPAPLLIAFYGPVVGGGYVMVFQVLRAPVALVVKSASDVFHQSLVKCVAEGKSPAAMIDRTAGKLLALGLLPTLLLIVVAPRLIPWILGEAWAQTGAMAAAIAPALLMQFAVAPVSQTMSVFRSYQTKLGYDLANLTLTTGCLTVCYWQGGSALLAIHAMTWSKVATYLYFWYLARSLAKRSALSTRMRDVGETGPDSSNPALS